MSQNFEKFGVEAVWADAKFEKGVADYNQSMKKADQSTQKFTKDATKSFQQFDRQASASFLDAAAKVGVWATSVKRAYAQVVQATQEAAQRASLQALAASYGVDGGKIIAELRKVSGETLSTADAVGVANSALLAGGASFAAEIPRLFKIAQSAALATGQDVNFVLDTLVRGIAKGSPLLIDNAEIYLSLGDAVEDYATKLGKTTDELTRQERTQATLQAVLEQGQTIVEGVGSSALEATSSISQFNAAGKTLAETLRAAAISTFDTSGVLDFLTRGLQAAAKAAAIAAGGLAALFNLIKNTGIDDIAALVTGQTTLNEILDESAQVGIDAFTSTAEALGVFVSEEQAAIPVTQELGDAVEETAGDIQKFTDTIANARTQALEAFLQRAIQTERQLEDAAIARARKVEQIEQQAANRRAQIEEQYATTVENLQAQAAEDRRSRQINLARQLEQIERQYQERKRAIQEQFSVSFQRAVRSRDALALVEAIRTRNKDLNEAKRQRDQERSDATTNAAQQEEEQKRSLERQLDEARRAREQQILEAQEAQQQQLEDLRRSDEQQAQDRARANSRWLEDQQRAFRDRQVQAMAQYRNDETIYLDHLQRMLGLTNIYIPRIFSQSVAGGGRRPSSGGGGGGPQMMAQGGAFIASGATPFVAGEAGPELVIAQPLSQIANTNPVSPQIGGQMQHAISGEIQASMAGFQGRLTAEINNAVLRAFRDVLR